MRPVLIGDVLAMARALMPVPSAARPNCCARWLQEVEAADKYRKRHARCHARWGNGSLMSHATRMAGPNALAGATLENADFCQCLQVVLVQLGMWRQVKAARGGGAEMLSAKR
ncbi:hypothetical protein N6L24_04480 [Cognatishimia sp. SS12]|uniref:DUF7742 family protein n=1 Tax=Cognatishimia sp. SS12 TaxID=2979465 RepID=UPI00232C0002|nr:hypothetical protein [Cognatishimia sp. SS12]MDC0737522.1 hypothetical protein [Cognatishimia sp. SS12]